MRNTDTEVRYTFTVADNISPQAERIAGSQKGVEESTKAAQAAVDSQRIAFIAQIAAVSALYAGMNMLNTSMKDLGVINEKTYETLHKVSAGVGLVVGSFQMIRGGIEIINSLRASEIALAAVESYRAVLNNPAKVALVGIGLGAAAGVGGYFAGRASVHHTTNRNVSQTFNFNSQNLGQNERSFARDTLELMGG